jgi:hypothetical protein
LAGSGAALAAGAIVTPVLAASANPDAELIALADHLVQNEVEYARHCWADDEWDPRHTSAEQPAALAAFRAAQEAEDAGFERLGELTATTPAGLRAKARAVVAFYEGAPPCTGDVAGAALWGLVLDLTGRRAEA